MWRSEAVPLDWQTEMVVFIFNKGDQWVSFNYQRITILRHYARVPESSSCGGWLGM